MRLQGLHTTTSTQSDLKLLSTSETCSAYQEEVERSWWPKPSYNQRHYNGRTAKSDTSSWKTIIYFMWQSQTYTHFMWNQTWLMLISSYYNWEIRILSIGSLLCFFQLYSIWSCLHVATNLLQGLQLVLMYFDWTKCSFLSIFLTKRPSNKLYSIRCSCIAKNDVVSTVQ